MDNRDNSPSYPQAMWITFGRKISSLGLYKANFAIDIRSYTFFPTPNNNNKFIYINIKYYSQRRKISKLGITRFDKNFQ